MLARNDKAEALFIRASEQWEKKNLRSAFRLFLAAGKLGHSGAQVNLGHFYDTAVAVKPNREAALYWYRKAYKAGMSVAASNIGTIYRDENKLDKTAAWFLRAVALGDPEPNLELAKIYRQEGHDAQKIIACLDAVRRAKRDAVTPAGRTEAQKLLREIRANERHLVRSIRKKRQPPRVHRRQIS